MSLTTLATPDVCSLNVRREKVLHERDSVFTGGKFLCRLDLPYTFPRLIGVQSMMQKTFCKLAEQESTSMEAEWSILEIEHVSLHGQLFITPMYCISIVCNSIVRNMVDVWEQHPIAIECGESASLYSVQCMVKTVRGLWCNWPATVTGPMQQITALHIGESCLSILSTYNSREDMPQSYARVSVQSTGIQTPTSLFSKTQ